MKNAGKQWLWDSSKCVMETTTTKIENYAFSMQAYKYTKQ